VVIEPLDVTSPVAVALLREYFTDVVGRFRGRVPTDAELDQVMAEESSERLAGESGVFLVVRDADRLVGCVGLREIAPGVCEIKRMYVRPEVRGRGIGAALLAEAEGAARARGAREIRLDTMAGLTEARSLYAARGYVEVERYNDNPYAEHWYAKPLAP
jgi:GNAT superfamily N-acetyltransferase